MSVISKYNKGSQFDIDTEGFKFYKLSKIYKVSVHLSKIVKI